MSAGIENLACFVPALVQRRLLGSPEPQKHSTEQFPAVVLFADISGFTPLAARLAERGPEGAEELNRILDAYYGVLVDLICDHGGDVVAYAGDALFAVWPADDQPLAAAVVRSAQCGLEIQAKLKDFAAAPDVRLSMRVSISAGDLLAVHVGGVDNCWQMVFTGGPLDQLRAADKCAPIGAVVVSPQAWRQCKDSLAGEHLAGKHLRLLSVPKPTPVAPLVPPMLGPEAEPALRSYVPNVVLSRYDAGHSQWMAELRRATVMFMRFAGIGADGAGESSRLQTVMLVLQQTMRRYEGTIVQLMADDKGTIGIACFGLPPLTHQDDAIRAVHAAAAIQAQLRREAVRADIGISTGRVFCGPRGSSRRREYSVIGDIVNLSARLMQQSDDDILCDGQTEQATSGKMEFCRLPLFKLKGLAEPVPVFRPHLSGGVVGAAADTMVGRASEQRAIEELLDEARRGESGTMLIEGEAGAGKSRLVTELLARAQAGLRPLVGECSSIERHTAYFPWRIVFSRLLHLDAVLDPDARRRIVAERLARYGDTARFAPLLNPVLSVDFPDDELSRQLSSRARADNLHRLLAMLLNTAASETPLLIVLEDVHWQDSASWALARHVAEQVAPLSLVLVARTMTSPPEECAEILKNERARRLRLSLLTRDETVEVVGRLLGVSRLSDTLASFAFQQSQGNPFFAEELAKFLRDAGLVYVSGGCCELQPAAQGDMHTVVPNTVRDLVTSRIDQLPFPHQLTLKTASVIGRQFAHRLLQAIHPIDADRPRIEEHLGGLAQQDLTRVEVLKPEVCSIFKHVTIQQIAYDQMTVAQRQPLHRAVAEWYERDAQSVPAKLPLLAYHWGRAEVPEKELKYLAKSGEDSLRAGANREAVDFFEAALQCHADGCDDIDSAAEVARRAHWLRQLGEAYYKLGNLPLSREHLEHSLELFGCSVPATRWGLALGVAAQVTVQAWHRVWPPRTRAPSTSGKDVESRDGEVLDVAQETTLADQRLAQLHYFANDIGRGAYNSLRSLNTAETIGNSPGLARSYASMCIVIGMLPWHRMAARYARLAEEAARQASHLPTLAYVLNVCHVYFLGVGQWDKVRNAAEESVAISERLGDTRLLGESVTVQAMLECFVANFGASREHFERVLAIGRQSANSIYQAWGHCGIGECLYRQGQFSAAIEALDKAGQLLEGQADRTEEVRVAGLLAAAHWREGRERAALDYAERASAVISQSRHTTASTLEGFAGSAEVHLWHWEKNAASQQARRTAVRACAQLKRYAKSFRIGCPRAWRLRGLAEWLSGRHGRALACWRRSLRSADELAMPLEAALTHCEIVRSGDVGQSERESHLTQALEIFERLGTAHEMATVRQRLQRG